MNDLKGQYNQSTKILTFTAQQPADECLLIVWNLGQHENSSMMLN